jgi:hypothetical protein
MMANVVLPDRLLSKAVTVGAVPLSAARMPMALDSMKSLSMLAVAPSTSTPAEVLPVIDESAIVTDPAVCCTRTPVANPLMLLAP